MSERLTDTGNAAALIRMFGDTIRYCPAMCAWYVWDGRRWQEDNTGELVRMAQEVAESYLAQASELKLTDQNRKPLIRWAHRSESLRGLRSMVELAQMGDGVCVAMEAFNRNHDLLNVENGTLNLTTGEFHTFDPSNMITLRAPVTYLKGARSGVWEQFLAQVLPDPDTRAFIQAAVGYSLTGHTREDKLFMLHGSGRNGKTTFLGTIQNMLGDYAAQASSRILVAKADSGPRNDLFVLIGKRFVAAAETGESHKLDEELIKQLTGGDPISINPKYRNQMEFTPTWKMWFSTNHEPVIVGTDTAIWSRVVKVPFSVTFTERQCDTKLKHRLFHDRTERGGILNWALEGVRMWRQNGLTLSKEITDSTKYYRATQDLTGQFLSECCRMHPKLMVAKSELYGDYIAYCRGINEHPKSKNAFSRELHTRGINGDRSTNSRHWIGINTNNHVSLLPCDAV